MTSWRTGSNVVEENATSVENLYSHHMPAYKTKCVMLCERGDSPNCSFTLQKITNCNYFRTERFRMSIFRGKRVEVT
jgi:hypothetical protein